MERYETEETDEYLFICNQVHLSYEIIHGKSYEKVLFSIAELYRTFIFDSFRNCGLILCKRLKLKSEIEEFPSKYTGIKFEFFLPGFLPISALISDQKKKMFEDDYETMRDSILSVNNTNLMANSHYLAKILEEEARKLNSIENFKAILNRVPQAARIVNRESEE